MFKRWWRYVVALVSNNAKQVEDPEVLLSQAQREMTEMHAHNCERAVQAITQKNNLQQMVDDTQKRVDNLQARAVIARASGDDDTAERLDREREGYETTLTMTRQNLAPAIETVDAVKTAIRREEETIRQKTAEALALKAQWKNRRIQDDLFRQRFDLFLDARPPSDPNPALPVAIVALIVATFAAFLSAWLLYVVR